MTRSSSPPSEASSHLVQAQPTKSKKPRVKARRAHKLDKAKAAVKEAAKRAYKTKKLAEPSVAYVGNIGPDVDEDELKAHFSGCGKVISARIRCCGGVATTATPPPANYHQSMRARQYGIIVFESKSARHKACKLESTLKGRKLVVSVLISDLPEVREKIAKRLEDYRSRMEPPDVHRAQKSALRSLKLEPTVLLDPRHEDQRKLRNQFQWLGHSLREGIM